MTIRYIDKAIPKNSKITYLNESGSDDVEKKQPKLFSPIKEKSLSFAVGGPVSAIGGAKRIENQLPMMGQTMGSFVPTPLGSYLGSIGGATLGQTGKQAIEKLRGEEFNPSAIRNEALTTGAIEGVMRGPAKFLFRKQIGGALREKVGKEIGSMAKKVSQSQIGSFARVGTKDLIDKINTILASSPERGEARSALINARRYLMSRKAPLTFDETLSLEKQLGREAKFATEASQGRMATSPKAPEMNQTLKGLRGDVSKEVDTIAQRAGFPEYASKSKEFGKLAEKYSEKELQKGFSPSTYMLRGAIGAAGTSLPGLMGGNPLLSVGAGTISALSLLSPKIKTMLYRKYLGTPMAREAMRIGRIGASNTARENV